MLISFLPAIHIDAFDRKPDSVALLDDPELCKELTKSLKLEHFFLNKEGWDSNGFLTYLQSHIGEKSQTDVQSDTDVQSRIAEKSRINGKYEVQGSFDAHHPGFYWFI